MKTLALALASLAAVALAAPMANAETVVIKRGGHHYHHGWDRSRAEYRMHREFRPYHRHHDRTVIIKHRD
jgi:Ni/Co efflux regulator RcnB